MIHLSLDEKIKLLSGDGPWHTNSCDGKLPSIMMTDGPHGLRKQEDTKPMQNNTSKSATCFPTESAIACSWDPEVSAKMAAAIAKEALAEKVSIVLGCGVNIKRSPLCGRNFEYFSEDPYLTGTLATSYIRTMEEMGVATSLKHFAGNSQETRRQTANSQIDERALHEIYLTAFEMVVKHAKPSTIMASYNRLNGTYSCENKELLTDLLRKEWGYDGLVMSDWGACVNLTKCIQAGMQLEMPDSLGIHGKQLKNDLVNGKISEAEIEDAVRRIQQLVEKQTSKLKECTVDYEAQHQIARELECESAVLLKNEGILPLSNDQEVLVVGDMACHMRFQGGGSSHIHTNREPNAVERLKQAGLQVTYVKGYESFKDITDPALEKEAIQSAKDAKIILFFGGLTENYEGEGYDRKTLAIPENQKQLLAKIAKVNDQIVFVAFGGAPMDFSFEGNAKAILHMYLGGQAVDEACADLITGKKNPCGKLAETYPLMLEDVPSYRYFGKQTDDVEYRESLFVGYRYYTTYQVPVRYCFGYGLSYTNFEYSDLEISEPVCCDDVLEVSLNVSNTGKVFGKEIVQLYIQNPVCNYLRPRMELKGFTKVSLAPGETKKVMITLERQSFRIYDEKEHKFLVPSGDYEILIGASSSDIRLRSTLHVDGVDYLRDDRKRYAEYFQGAHHPLIISQKQFETLYQRPLSHFDDQKPGQYSTYNTLQQLAPVSFLARITIWYAKRLVQKMYPGKSMQDPEVMMTWQGILEGTLDCVICQSGGVPYRLAEAIVLSANGHTLKALGKLL